MPNPHGSGHTATLLDNGKVIIWKAFYDTDWPSYLATPGQVVGRRDGEGVLVKTGDATLLVQEIQLDESNPQIPDWPISTRLGRNIVSTVSAMQAKIDRLELDIELLGHGNADLGD